MLVHVLKVAALLFCSGLCALVYQTTWLRELRLIFGASTPASAAVLGIFMGGLGIGGLVLGRRAEAARRPLVFYAWLELGIALAAALTPALVALGRAVYVAAGGAAALGLPLGTALRLALATLVLGVPTLLMGGTLPAAARAVATERDVRRRGLAVLYGLNTLGAVTGAMLSTFVLLERLGNRRTLWLACGLNVIVALLAFWLAPPAAARSVTPDPDAPPADAPPVPGGQRLVLAAAALVGLSFLLMELVWYRMLAPLLGGSTFTFGLILGVALLGIGLGGVVYSLWGERRPATLGGFAATCLLEAILVLLPFALGDRVALLALDLRPQAAASFATYLGGWAAVSALCVLPAALVSGFQFPLLIALLGRGGREVARQVGLCYAWNTAGAIVGSLAGGFGLLPLLTAPGTWRLAGGLLLLLGLVAAARSLRQAPSLRPALLTALAALLGGGLLLAPGPSAAWRHAGIGAGRAGLTDRSGNGTRAWQHARRRGVTWQREGVESSVALDTSNGAAFIVNGKADGNAKGDAAMQVMGGLVGAALHPQPRRALVVGLGTGSTAGWLGAVPGIERVDVAEIEPAILDVARACRAVNEAALENPKLHLFLGDARELLLTSRRRYDIIFSEPSNPYRAGIASLYTREFYAAAAARLDPGGLFVQWLQSYEVDDETVRTIYATLASAFPAVETWMAEDGDLLLIGTAAPLRHDLPALRARIAQEPLRRALAHTWRVDTVEGFLAHHVARPAQAAEIAAAHTGPLNTDDRTLVEFGFARSIGKPATFNYLDLWLAAKARGWDLPDVGGGALRADLIELGRMSLFSAIEHAPPMWPHHTAVQRARVLAHGALVVGDLGAARAAWRQLPPGEDQPGDLTELALVATALADVKDEGALRYLGALRRDFPAEADAALARLRFRQGRLPEATAALEATFLSLRQEPWPLRPLMVHALQLAEDVGLGDRALGARLFEVLRQPFAVSVLDRARVESLMVLSERLGFDGRCLEVAERALPHVPWQRRFLLWRLNCYRTQRDPRTPAAEADLRAFLAAEVRAAATAPAPAR